MNQNLSNEKVDFTKEQLESNVEVILLTPELADKFLSEQRPNRKLKKNNLYKLMNDIESGRYVYNGDPIRFDKQGRMGDGQHRCYVCKATGKSFYVLVVRNLPEEAFPTIDIGASRTAGDVFNFAGVTNGNSIAAGIRCFLGLKKEDSNIFLGGLQRGTSLTIDGSRRNLAFTNPEILSEYQNNPSAWDEISKRVLSYVRPLMLLNSGFAIGFYAYLLLEKKHKEEEVNTFFEGLLSKRDSEYEVINLMKDKLRRRKDYKNKGKFSMEASQLLGLLSKCWNYYLKGTHVENLVYSKDKEGIINIL